MKAKACRQLQTALQALYGHYEKTFELWAREKISVPPCFIIVCNNTSASKLVYDYISRFQQPHKDGASKLVEGRLPLFRNCDEHGNPLGRPKTLLIDSEQLEPGEALDDNFRTTPAKVIVVNHFALIDAELVASQASKASRRTTPPRATPLWKSPSRFSLQVARTNTLTTVLGLDVFQYDFALTVTNLAAGTYWLALHNGALSAGADEAEFYWAWSDENATNGGTLDDSERSLFPLDLTWGANQAELAFLIAGERFIDEQQISEPGTLLLATLAAGLGLTSSRRRATA